MRAEDDRPDFILPSPVGMLGVKVCGEQVTAIVFLGRGHRTRRARSPFACHVAAQLAAYFEDGTHVPDVPVRLHGSDFQCRVWHALRGIPAGATQTYGQLARRLGTSPRAVGNACRANPVPLVVPCHRVVAATGIGGFAGRTDGPEVARKHWLLQHEARA